MVSRVKTPETRDQALHRLAAQARERGIQIHVYDLGNAVEYYATSITRKGTLHRVTMLSCDCAGFQRHQRCGHFARLLAEVGELPELTPDPAPPTQPDTGETTDVELQCEACAGSQFDAILNHAGKWIDVSCPICNGRGTVDVELHVIDVAHFDHVGLNTIRGRQCGRCHGRGYDQISTGGRISDWVAQTCRSCQGAGLVPIPARSCDLVVAA